MHTCENGVFFLPQKLSEATSASIIDSAFVYRFKRLIVGISDISSTGTGLVLPACVRIMSVS